MLYRYCPGKCDLENGTVTGTVRQTTEKLHARPSWYRRFNKNSLKRSSYKELQVLRYYSTTKTS